VAPCSSPALLMSGTAHRGWHQQCAAACIPAAALSLLLGVAWGSTAGSQPLRTACCSPAHWQDLWTPLCGDALHLHARGLPPGGQLPAPDQGARPVEVVLLLLHTGRGGAGAAPCSTACPLCVGCRALLQKVGGAHLLLPAPSIPLQLALRMDSG